MNVSQAIELASSLFIPEFLLADGVAAVESEREKTEEAIRALRDDWFAQPAGKETFSFDLVRELADRNRRLCDLVETSDDPAAQALAQRRANANGLNLARGLSEADLVKGVAALQRRSDRKIAKMVGGNLDNLAVAYVDAPIKGTVVGIDIETTSRHPDRGYIVNVGWQTMDLTPDAVPRDGEAVWCGLPPAWEGRPVPLEAIHHITSDMLAGKTPLREDKALQRRLVSLLSKHPYMAHNAAFEDSWFLLHLDGYAEARKRGKIVPIDTRDICRRVDKDTVGLPRESHPNTLENWARRRGTLDPSEKERHLGLDDTDLMLRTVQAEFTLRNMFAGMTKQAKPEGAGDAPAEPTDAETTAKAAADTATPESAHEQPSPTPPAAPAPSKAQRAEATTALAQALATTLASVAAQGPDQLASWTHAWVSQAVAQLPSWLASEAYVSELDAQGFVATLSSRDHTTANSVVLQARVSIVDQGPLAAALAQFAVELAVAQTASSLPDKPCSLACFR